jgi:transposase
MSKTRKTYTAEFKLQAVRMVTDPHLAVAEVARRLGVTEGRLHDWLKAYRAGGVEAFPGHGRLSPQDEEWHRLRAEIQRLEAERDILKTAAAYFASHPSGPSRSSTSAATSGRWGGGARRSTFRPPGTTPGGIGPPARPDSDGRRCSTPWPRSMPKCGTATAARGWPSS